ncbi:MAG: hypothetical protein H7331_04605 [Bacteroidia bacterium]|nr:hypothetical protein [Bacteroidia bacterium]
MKKHIILISIVLSIKTICAQSTNGFYITPTVGIKADVNYLKINNKPEDYFQFHTQYILKDKPILAPLLLGVNLEYVKNKQTFGFGIVTGDQANSKIGIEFYTKDTSPYTNYKSYNNDGVYAGMPILKVPLFYKKELARTYSSINKEKKIRSLSLYTGIDLMFLNIKNKPVFFDPISHGKSLTPFGDSIEIVTYAGHNNKNKSISFKLGLSYELYRKGRRFLEAQLYFEQGTRVVSRSAIFVIKNNEPQPWFGVNSISRGSSIQFKLAFPIKVYAKKEVGLPLINN